MKLKIICIAGLLCVCNLAFSQDDQQPNFARPDVGVRLKSIEDRLDSLEKDVHELKVNQPIVSPIGTAQLSDQEISVWSKNAIETIYNYSHINYSTVMTDVRHYFTPSGYEGYMNALKESNNLQAIQDKKLSLKGVVTGAPVVLKQGANAGVYTWEVQLPVQVTYQGPAESFKQNLLITIDIVRVLDAQSSKGVAIDNLVAEVAPQAPPKAAAPTTPPSGTR